MDNVKICSSSIGSKMERFFDAGGKIQVIGIFSGIARSVAFTGKAVLDMAKVISSFALVAFDSLPFFNKGIKECKKLAGVSSFDSLKQDAQELARSVRNLFFGILVETAPGVGAQASAAYSSSRTKLPSPRQNLPGGGL